MSTNWSTPKRNIIAGMLDLRKALAAGQNARLQRMANEDCAFPIKVRNSITDFRAYECSVGLLKTRQGIIDDPRMPAFEKYLALNYKACYGTEAAMKRYYETGKLSSDNFKGIGRSHLVRVEDMVRFFTVVKDDRAEMFRSQYLDEQTANQTHFYDHYRLKREHDIYTISRFKRKLWVVELLRDDKPKAVVPWTQRAFMTAINIIVFPFKFIPERRVMKMDEYKVVTYRIGAVTNGFSIDIHIPKKFSFN